MVTPKYWKVREWWPFPGMWQVLIYRIDEHGQAEAVGHGLLDEGESLEDLHSLSEAISEHMAPAAAEANANSKRLAEKRRRQEPEAQKEAPAPPMDRATERFFRDGDEIDYEAFEHSRRRL